MAQLPARFRVGARVGRVNGGGTLTVGIGSLVFESDRLTRRLSGVRQIVHHGRRVVFVEARLVPPWFNTGLVLEGDSQARVVTWLGRAAGFSERLSMPVSTSSKYGPGSR